jgi:hypothetical protein
MANLEKKFVDEKKKIRDSKAKINKIVSEVKKNR